MPDPTLYREELWECLRCGALVERMVAHRRWHEQLEGTSDPLPPDPGRSPDRSVEERAPNLARLHPRRLVALRRRSGRTS